MDKTEANPSARDSAQTSLDPAGLESPATRHSMDEIIRQARARRITYPADMISGYEILYN